MKNKLLLFALAVISVAIPGALSHVEDSHAAVDGTKVFVLGKKPHRVEGYLDQGDTYRGTIGLRNENDETATVTFTPKPYSFVPKDDDFIPSHSSANPFTELSNWLKFPDGDRIDLPAGAEREVKYEFTVPKGAITGTQTASILIHTVKEAEEASSTGVSAEASFSYIIYANINGIDLKEEGNIVSWDTASFVSGPPIKVRSVVENTGNASFIADYKLEVFGVFAGKDPVYTHEEKADVLPENKRAVFQYWNEAPLLGIFNVTETISFLGEDYDFSKTVFLCPIWLIILVAVFVILAIVLIVHRSQKRKSGASHA